MQEQEQPIGSPNEAAILAAHVWATLSASQQEQMLSLLIGICQSLILPSSQEGPHEPVAPRPDPTR